MSGAEQFGPTPSLLTMSLFDRQNVGFCIPGSVGDFEKEFLVTPNHELLVDLIEARFLDISDGPGKTKTLNVVVRVLAAAVALAVVAVIVTRVLFVESA